MGSGSVLRVLAFWWIAASFGADFALNLAQLFGIPFRKGKVAAGAAVPSVGARPTKPRKHGLPRCDG